MYYPKNGGYKQFLSDIANDLNICYDYDAVRIDSKNKKVYFANGETCNYETLISTIPLPDLAKMLDVSSNVKKAAENLKSTSILLISVGFNKNIEFPSLWFYVYDENIPFARVHSPSMKSPQNSPLGCSSLQFEIYFSLEHPLKFSTDELVKKTLDCMEKMKLAKRSDIKILDYRYVLHANVIYYKNMEVYRDFVKKAIQSKGIKLCGRFGEWEYLWSYQSFLSGYNVT